MVPIDYKPLRRATRRTSWSSNATLLAFSCTAWAITSRPPWPKSDSSCSRSLWTSLHSFSHVPRCLSTRSVAYLV
jgi:hypothetical protein